MKCCRNDGDVQSFEGRKKWYMGLVAVRLRGMPLKFCTLFQENMSVALLLTPVGWAGACNLAEGYYTVYAS